MTRGRMNDDRMIISSLICSCKSRRQNWKVRIVAVFRKSLSSSPRVTPHDLNRNSHQGLFLFSFSAKTLQNSMHFRPDFFAKSIQWSFFSSCIDIGIQNTAQKQTIISTITEVDFYTLYKIRFILKPGTFYMIFVA